jgi:hypothetical protein
MRDRSASAESRLASSGPKIYISYRTRDHGEYVEPLAVALSSSGFTVLLDRQKNLEDYRFGDLDLPLTGGLALGLRSLLRAADVAVVLVSNAPRRRVVDRSSKKDSTFSPSHSYEGRPGQPRWPDAFLTGPAVLPTALGRKARAVNGVKDLVGPPPYRPRRRCSGARRRWTIGASVDEGCDVVGHGPRRGAG